LHLELTRSNRIVKKVPKGTSEYQSSWILEDDEDHGENDNGSDEDSTGEMMEDEMIAEMKDDSTEETVCIHVCYPQDHNTHVNMQILDVEYVLCVVFVDKPCQSCFVHYNSSGH
jgi:hypothetical protein